MPYRHHAAILLALGVFASIPASGQQIVPDFQGNRGSGWTPPPRHMEPRQLAPWSAAPAPGPGTSAGTGAPSGGISQLQAMNLLAAAGYTDILPPEPTAYGGWVAYASWQGRKVRATVDAKGQVATRQ